MPPGQRGNRAMTSGGGLLREVCRGMKVIHPGGGMDDVSRRVSPAATHGTLPRARPSPCAAGVDRGRVSEATFHRHISSATHILQHAWAVAYPPHAQEAQLPGSPLRQPLSPRPPMQCAKPLLPSESRPRHGRPGAVPMPGLDKLASLARGKFEPQPFAVYH